MATPSSQMTTPSPQMLPQSIARASSATAPSRKRSHPDDIDDVDPGLEAFLSGVHYAKLTRELRARLSYATFKASRNASHIPLSALESQWAAHPRQKHLRYQPLSPKYQLSHTKMMPPPPSPQSQALYTSLIADRHVLSAKRTRQTLSENQRSRNPFSYPHSGRNIHNRSFGLSSEKDDINAAATLTSLLLNRPGGPRSESSLSRTSSAASTSTLIQSQPSSQQSQGATFVESRSRSAAAPAAPSRLRTPPPDDNVAAELMLYLATSPSPARGSSKRPESHSGPAAKPRVLFANQDASKASDSRRTLPSQASSSQLLPPPPSPQRHKRSGSTTPNPPFNFGDFINITPSPASNIRTPLVRPAFVGGGRRLFADDDVASASTSHPDMSRNHLGNTRRSSRGMLGPALEASAGT